VPWSFDARASRDTWNGFHEEREEIFNHLEKNKISGIVLLSADRHRSDVRRIDRAEGYPFYEFTSSRLTNEHVHPLLSGAICGYNEKQSFGLVSFDTTKKDPTVTFKIISIDNEMINTFVIPLCEISHGAGGNGLLHLDGIAIKSKDLLTK
jgi:alkaline phosphatase D